jgi:hypothetical protein
MVQEYNGPSTFDEMKAESDDGITITTGQSLTTTGASVSWANPARAGIPPLTKQPRVIANGSDLILLDISSGSENMYFIYRDFNVSDMNIEIHQDNFPCISLTGRAYGGGVECRQINVPDHIPIEQHARYIQGVFDKAGGIDGAK